MEDGRRSPVTWLCQLCGGWRLADAQYTAFAFDTPRG
jgi:hypothetical protein